MSKRTRNQQLQLREKRLAELKLGSIPHPLKQMKIKLICKCLLPQKLIMKVIAVIIALAQRIWLDQLGILSRKRPWESKYIVLIIDDLLFIYSDVSDDEPGYGFAQRQRKTVVEASKSPLSPKTSKETRTLFDTSNHD